MVFTSLLIVVTFSDGFVLHQRAAEEDGRQLCVFANAWGWRSRLVTYNDTWWRAL